MSFMVSWGRFHNSSIYVMYFGKMFFISFITCLRSFYLLVVSADLWEISVKSEQRLMTCPDCFSWSEKEFISAMLALDNVSENWLKAILVCVCVRGSLRKHTPECEICHGPGLKMMELFEVQDVINTAHWSTLSRCLLQGLREKQSLTVRLPQIPSIMSQLFHGEQLTFSFSFHVFTLSRSCFCLRLVLSWALLYVKYTL